MDGEVDPGPDFASEPLRSAVLAVFQAEGATGDVQYVADTDRTEALFVVSTSGAANLHERNVVVKLTNLLKRKVFVTTESSATDGRTTRL